MKVSIIIPVKPGGRVRLGLAAFLLLAPLTASAQCTGGTEGGGATINVPIVIDGNPADWAGIDPIAVGDIQALVRHLTNRGIGVLITDHNVRETLGLTDRAYIIYSGEVLMEGRADDIVNNPDVRRLYLGEEFRL